MSLTMKKRDRENLNPTPQARAAMALYCDEYAAQRGGSMDFWEKLPPYKRQRCDDLVDGILAAAKAHRQI
jgi:hypothetical protein